MKCNVKSLRKKSHEKTVGDIMASSPQCIDLYSSVQTAFDNMLKFNLMSLIVIEKDRFVGLVTRRDLDRAMHMNLHESEIANHLPAHSPTVTPTTRLYTLKRLMIKYNLTRMAVLNDSKIVGIVSIESLLKALPDNLPKPPKFSDTALFYSPKASELKKILKRLFPLRVSHLLKHIGQFASEKCIKAFAVGGFVRDLLLERQNFDIDIVIVGNAISFVKDLSQELQCDYKIFDRFNTARLYVDDLKVDFNSSRIEYYSNPGALPQIEFSGLSNDMFRRDFSINAIALALEPKHFLELNDFFGGYQDIKQKQIRILHSFSFLEDPTRLFRAVRFATRFNFALSENTKKAFEGAISQKAPKKLSMKRIGAEISRCLNEEKPQIAIARLFETELMQYLSPEFTDAKIIPSRFKLIRGLVRRFQTFSTNIDTESILWAGLLSVIPENRATQILDSIGCPHNIRKTTMLILLAIRNIPTELQSLDTDAPKELFNLLHEEPLEALIALIAFTLDKKNARKILHFIIKLRHISCQISGHDLIEVGIKPGARIRKIFDHIIELKLNGAKLTRQQEIEIAKQQNQNL